MIRFDKFSARHGLIRRGPGWSFDLVSRDAPWWVKARAIRGVRWVTARHSFWLSIRGGA